MRLGKKEELWVTGHANIFIILLIQKQAVLLRPMHSSIYLNGPPKSLSSSRDRTIPENQSLDNYLRKKAEEYFFKLAAQQITNDQMKVEFSKDILTMFLTSVPADIVSQAHIQQMEQHLQENMTFLKTLYPEPKPSVLSRTIFQGLTQADLSEKVEFDLLANLDFKYDVTNPEAPRMDILTQTEILLNNLIKSSQKTVAEFTNLLMVQIPHKLTADNKIRYENLMKQPWRFDLENDIAKTKLYNKDLVSQKLYFPSLQLFRVISSWVQYLQTIIQDPHDYLLQTQFLKQINGHHVNARFKNQKNQARIFNHFPTHDNADSGSSVADEQPKANTLPEDSRKQVMIGDDQSWMIVRLFNKIKSMCSGEQDAAEIFQKIDTKFIYQPLEKSTYQYTITEPSIENVEKYTNLQFKNSGYLTKNYVECLQELNSEVQYKKFCEQQLQFLRKGYIQTIRVVDKNKIKQKYTIEEKKVYSFCQNSYYFMEEIVIERLIKLVQSFLKLRQKSANQYKKCMVFQDVDLIKFNEKNVISAFIISDERLLMDIYNAIIELTKTKQAKIAKIQNRFGTASNDATITLKIKNNPILCKLRLVLEQQKSGPEAKQKALGQMNEFLSQIERSPYGPISYLSLILATKDFRVTYLNSIRKQRLQGNVKLSQVCHCGKGNVSQKSSVNTFEKQVKNIITQQGTIKLDCYRNLIPSSFVCGVCEKVVKKGECVIPVPSCTECGFHICVECSFENNPQMQRNIYAVLMNAVAKIVDPCYFSQLELSDPSKKNYNHSFTKQVQVLANNKPEIRKQIHYHIILEGSNFVRFGKYTQESQFWEEIKSKINLRNLPEYKDAIKHDKCLGILFRPRELLREKGQPFIFLLYDSGSSKFFKYNYKIGEQRAVEAAISPKQVEIHENDAFLPILWIFGESLVTQYVTRVLQTNPFCVKRMPIRDLSLDHMRFSRSKISSHHIMR